MKVKVKSGFKGHAIKNHTYAKVFNIENGEMMMIENLSNLYTPKPVKGFSTWKRAIDIFGKTNWICETQSSKEQEKIIHLVTIQDNNQGTTITEPFSSEDKARAFVDMYIETIPVKERILIGSRYVIQTRPITLNGADYPFMKGVRL